ncbi:MAG: hypothetical protein IJR89_07470 [Clostridia bacterium]|nr:hypothetical protein [Clostridia bacterium]
MPEYRPIWTAEGDEEGRKTNVSTREKMLAWLQKIYTPEAAEALLLTKTPTGKRFVKEQDGLLYCLAGREGGDYDAMPLLYAIRLSFLSQSETGAEAEVTFREPVSHSDLEFASTQKFRFSHTKDGWRISGYEEEPTTRFMREKKDCPDYYQPVGISLGDFMLLYEAATHPINHNNELRVKTVSVPEEPPSLPLEKEFNGSLYQLCAPDYLPGEDSINRLRSIFSEELAWEYYHAKRDGVPLFEEWEGRLYVLKGAEDESEYKTCGVYWQRAKDTADYALFHAFVTASGTRTEEYIGYYEIEAKKIGEKWFFTKYAAPAYCSAHPETLSAPYPVGAAKWKN